MSLHDSVGGSLRAVPAFHIFLLAIFGWPSCRWPLYFLVYLPFRWHKYLACYIEFPIGYVRQSTGAECMALIDTGQSTGRQAQHAARLSLSNTSCTKNAFKMLFSSYA